jgi:hypothetical protein
LVEQPKGFNKTAEVAKRGANTAKVAREQLEKETGKPAISKLNAKGVNQIAIEAGDSEWHARPMDIDGQGEKS